MKGIFNRLFSRVPIFPTYISAAFASVIFLLAIIFTIEIGLIVLAGLLALVMLLEQYQAQNESHWFFRYLGNELGLVVGLRGSGQFTDAPGQRPTNYREQILLQFPNSPVALTALMSKLRSENTNDPKFTIFTKQLPTQRATITGTIAAGTTQLDFSGTTPAKQFKKGMSLINPRTLEVVWVVADPSGAYTSVEVIRGRGSSAAEMTTGDIMCVVGTHHQEGAATPTAITYDPTEWYNWTQIFRTSLAITNTMRATHLRTGSDLMERQRETLELHAMERENAYIWGTGVEDTTGAQPERTTKGFVSLVTTNVTDFADAFDIDTWESFLEDVFEDGSSEKLMFAGNSALTTINKVGRIHGQIQMTPRNQTYGIALQTYVTPYGDLQMRQHPLFSKNPIFKDWGIVIDTRYLVDRILSGNGVNRDTQYLENQQPKGTDMTIDEWLTESGLELQFESCNGCFKNASAFVP